MATPPIHTRKVGGNTPAKDFNPFACLDRKSPAAGPKDISLLLFTYLPLDKDFSTVWEGKNIFKMTIHRQRLESGRVYRAFDGHRLIIEVGCQTIIYLHINPIAPTHHKFLIESTEAFFSAVTAQVLAAEVARRTTGIETIAKYEIFFLLGMFSTLSLGAWLAITGSDITVTLATNKHKIDGFKELAKVFLSEMDNIKRYAPTFHRKLLEFISNEASNTARQTAKNLPGHVIRDEKAQAQVAGILYGKYALSAASFTVWTALATVLTQAVVKSATNVPATYMETLDQRYVSIVRDLRNVDWENPLELQVASQKMAKIFQESKVPVSSEEAKAIFIEVKSHPKELEKSIINIFNAVTTFTRRK